MTVDASHPDGQTALDYNFGADKDLLIPNIQLVGEDADTYSRIINDVNTAIAETFLSVIIGNKPESAIDELYKTIDSMGIAQAIDIYAKVYANYLNKEILK